MVEWNELEGVGLRKKERSELEKANEGTKAERRGCSRRVSHKVCARYPTDGYKEYEQCKDRSMLNMILSIGNLHMLLQ